MLTKPERNRKKDLVRRLFEPRTAEEKNQKANREATADEVREFLELTGRDHRKYFHYTSLDSLCGMLRSGQMWLTRADCLNDLREFGRHRDRTFSYVASFGASALENIAMWWMYGLNGKDDDAKRVPVRLEFNGKALQGCVGGLVSEVPQKGQVGDFARPVSTDDGTEVAAVQNVAIHDMLYQRTHSHYSEKTGKRLHGAVSWNGLIADDVRCRAFEHAVCSFPGFVKDFGWAFENETRITIRLARKGTHPNHIAIPFVEALKTVRIVIGPGSFADGYFATAVKAIQAARKCQPLRSVTDWRNRIKPSSYQVHFSK